MTICALSSTSIFILSTDKQSSVRLNSRSSKLKDLTKSIRRQRDSTVRTRLNNSQFDSKCNHIPLQLRPQRHFPLPPPLLLPTRVRPRRLAQPISHPWCTHSPRRVQRTQAQLLLLLMLIRIMCSRRHPEPWEPCLPRRLQLRLVQDVLGAHRARPARDPRPIQFGRMHLVELLHTSVVLCFVDRERGVMC